MKGFVYVIRSHQTTDVYYGSTKQSLSKRMSGHRRDFKSKDKYVSSAIILQYDDAYIELVEEVEYENKYELLAREGYHIRSNKCVNKVMLGRTKVEYNQENSEKIKEKKKEYRAEHQVEIQKWRDDNKEEIKKYREEHSEEIKVNAKIYRDANKDVLKVKGKQYRDDNKKELRIYEMNYRVENKDKIKLRYQENKDELNKRRREKRKELKVNI